MRLSLRTFTSVALAACFAACFAQRQIQLSAYPTMSVADGRSTTTISATVLDASGRIVPDGTRVIFNTSLGSFRENVVQTVGGIARAVLIAGAIPGTAKITAVPITGGGAPTTLEFDFVANRALLSSAQEYIEVFAPGDMQYTADSKQLAASAANQGVSIRYRDVLINADDMQIDIPGYTIKARNATLKFGHINQKFSELYLKLNTRRGWGTTTYSATRYETIAATGRYITFFSHDPEGNLQVAEKEDRLGVVEIKNGEFEPAQLPIGANFFEFDDLSASPSTIRAKKAVVFPRKGIQFQKAEVFVGDTKVLKMPLFEMPLYNSDSPIATDQFVNINDSHLSVNYPYYLSLKPGQTSLLRLRTGESYGRSLAANRGVSLDYELNWNEGDEMDGGLRLGGIGRSDWTLGGHQFLRLDDRTSFNFDAEMPGGRAILGSMGVSRQFDGFQVNLNANTSRSLRGLPFQSQDLSLTAEKDPTKVGTLPMRLYYGLTALYNDNSLQKSKMQAAGGYVRAQSLPLKVDRDSTLTTAFTVRQLAANSGPSGTSYIGTAAISRRIGNGAAATLSYDYTKDNYNDRVLGSQKLGLQSYYSEGRTYITLYGSRGLDVDTASLYSDLSYRVSGSWRLGASYTLDQYGLGSVSQKFLDYNFVVGYRIGWREVGLTWSRENHRIGFQILGATVY